MRCRHQGCRMWVGSPSPVALLSYWIFSACDMFLCNLCNSCPVVETFYSLQGDFEKAVGQNWCPRRDYGGVQDRPENCDVLPQVGCGLTMKWSVTRYVKEVMYGSVRIEWVMLCRRFAIPGAGQCESRWRGCTIDPPAAAVCSLRLEGRRADKVGKRFHCCGWIHVHRCINECYYVVCLTCQVQERRQNWV